MRPRRAGMTVIGLLVAATAGAPTAPADDTKDEPRQGTAAGVVTAKGDHWIEIKADGEEKGRRYVPHWKGGLPKDGGGLDRDMLARLKATPLGARVRIEWVYAERLRIAKIDVLRRPDDKDKK